MAPSKRMNRHEIHGNFICGVFDCLPPRVLFVARPGLAQGEKEPEGPPEPPMERGVGCPFAHAVGGLNRRELQERIFSQLVPIYLVLPCPASYLVPEIYAWIGKKRALNPLN